MKIWLGAALVWLGLAAGAAAQALLPNGQQQFVDANGVPLAGGLVYFYQPGTTLAKTTWQDFAESVANTNPVVLNAAGRAIVWGSGEYREIVYDSAGNLIWDQITYAWPIPAVGSQSQGFGTQRGLAGGSTTDLGTVVTNNVLVTGAGANISSLGSSASLAAPVFLVTFQGANTLVNGANLVLAGGADMTVNSGDSALFEYEGSGAWKELEYQAVANSPLASGFGAQVTLVSATAVDLGTASGRNVLISGTTGIRSFGAAASTLQPFYLVQFSDALTVFHSGDIVTPGSQDIDTAAGGSALLLYDGGGIWRVLEYFSPTVATTPKMQAQTITTVGAFSYTISTNVDTKTVLEFVCVGSGGGGGSNSGGSGGGGGGASGAGYADYLISGFTGGGTITGTIPAGGTGSSNSANPGGVGANTVFTYNAVDFLTCHGGAGGSSATGGATASAATGGVVTDNLTGLTLVDRVLAVTGGTGGSGVYQGNNIGAGGAGGGSVLGQGGPGVSSPGSGTTIVGLGGSGYGSGGAGGASGGAAQTTGGNGTQGLAVIRGLW